MICEKCGQQLSAPNNLHEIVIAFRMVVRRAELIGVSPTDALKIAKKQIARCKKEPLSMSKHLTRSKRIGPRYKVSNILCQSKLE